MKRHHLLLGLLSATLLFAGCGHKESNEKQADQKQEETADTPSQDPSSKEKKETHTTHHTKQEITVEVHESEKKDKAKSNAESNKSKQAEQKTQQSDKTAQTTKEGVPTSQASEKDESANEDKGNSKAKGPESITPGPKAEAERKHIAMMLLNPKLNKTYVNAKELKHKTYKTDAGKEVRIPNYVLLQSLEVPQVENSPEGMQYYFVTHTKDSDKKTLIGVSDNEIVIGKSTISSEDAVSQKVKLDYNQFIQESDTQVFKIKDLEQLKLDTNEIQALTQHIYQTTPHTLQLVPEN